MTIARRLMAFELQNDSVSPSDSQSDTQIASRHDINYGDYYCNESLHLPTAAFLVVSGNTNDSPGE